jgi:hypothetical protein
MRIFGPEREKLTGGWKKLRDKFFDLYCTQNIIRVFKLRGMRWREHQ